MLRFFIGGAIGGIIGFFIGYIGKCSSGACPLTGNPIVSTIIGIVIGVVIVASLKGA